MKKTLILSFIAASTILFGCKSKSKDASEADSASTTTTTSSSSTSTEESKPASPANEPKTYTVTFSPDTVLLGKSKEGLLKVIPVSATDLSDPDGKSQGIELSFKISLTNKNKIGGNGGSVGIGPSDFRMTLDNNTSITQYSGSYFSAEPESTKESETITYRIPAGAKPKTLNLFYDQTRASVSVDLK